MDELYMKDIKLGISKLGILWVNDIMAKYTIRFHLFMNILTA